jgi:ribonuclease HI
VLTEKQVTIYTRGVASRSGTGGYGVVLLCEGHHKSLSGSAADSSNNRMDLLAAVEGLRALKFPCRVTLYNTNTYLIDAINKGWAQQWRSNGWRNSGHRSTSHTDLWEALLELCTKHQVIFQWLPYDPKNCEYATCDKRAHAAASKETTPTTNDFLAITFDLIEAGKSERGGWSKRQLACLGVPWPPPKSWKETAAGRVIQRSEAETFLKLKSNEPEAMPGQSNGKDKLEAQSGEELASPIRVNYEHKNYTWDGRQWFGTDDCTIPPQGIARKLDAVIAAQLEAEDAATTDANELLSQAKRAQSCGQLERAKRLAEGAHLCEPENIGAAAVLCSVLRELEHSDEALALADQYRNSRYPPILTCRAAALCDQERWEEALQQIRQVLAIGMSSSGKWSPEASAVHGRIKANAPELFE